MERNDEIPAFRAPPGACDAHFHVFGPAERYPHGPELRYAPPCAPLAGYLELAKRLGLERFVFVQPSAYGRDNRCMLDAMREVPGCRGIVDIDENAAESELARLHDAGVRGVRINVSPVKAPAPGFGATLLPRIKRLEARCAELGWQLDFLLPGWLTEALSGTLRNLRVDFTLAHFGMLPEGLGPILENPRCFVKLTGAYRASKVPDFSDLVEPARKLVESVPDRLIWGTDYPHLSHADKVSSVALFNLLKAWVPDEAARNRILVDNPARLYGLRD